MPAISVGSEAQPSMLAGAVEDTFTGMGLQHPPRGRMNELRNCLNGLQTRGVRGRASARSDRPWPSPSTKPAWVNDVAVRVPPKNALVRINAVATYTFLRRARPHLDHVGAVSPSAASRPTARSVTVEVAFPAPTPSPKSSPLSPGAPMTSNLVVDHRKQENSPEDCCGHPDSVHPPLGQRLFPMIDADRPDHVGLGSARLTGVQLKARCEARA